MSFVLFVYFASIVEKLGEMFALISILTYLVACGGLFAYFLFNLEWEKNERKIAFNCFKISLIVAITCNLFYVFIPSQKTMWLMAGAHYTQELAENPKVQSIGGNVLDVVNLKLEAIEKELKEDAVKSVDNNSTETN